MYKRPERKNYRYIISTTKGDCEFIFQQATARETQEYYEIMDLLISDDVEKQIRGLDMQQNYFEAFIENNISLNIKKRKKRQFLSLIKWDLDEYKWEIGGMLHPIRKSIYEWTNKPKIKWKPHKDYPFDNHYEVIREKTGIPIDQIYDRLTMEQVLRYIDKIVYDSYETFKEWQAINSMLMTKGWLSDEQKRKLDIIKQNLHPQKK